MPIIEELQHADLHKSVSAVATTTHLECHCQVKVNIGLP